MAMALTEIAQHLYGRNEELSSVIAPSLTEVVERRLSEELGFGQCGICGIWSYSLHNDDGCFRCIKP
jgi:hypothetical protein